MIELLIQVLVLVLIILSFFGGSLGLPNWGLR